MKKVLTCLAVAIALFSYGCSSRPALTAEEEGPYNECEALVKQADVDVDAAKQAGAETFAKDMYSTSVMSLENSKKFLELKDFPKAKESSMRASEEAKKTLAIPKQAEDGITETEKLINAGKEAKIDEESPVAFKEAVEQLEAAKQFYNVVDFASANLAALKAAAAIKKANEEPIAAKNAVAAVETDMTMAKELKIDQVSPDTFKVATEAYDLAKSSLATKDNPKAKENALKASTTLRDEMKKAVNLYVEQAKADVNTAKEAGASEFSAEQLAVAEESLTNANAAIEKNDFVNAKASAEKVTQTAKEAEAKAKAGKEAKAAADAATAAAAPATDVAAAPATDAAAAAPATDGTAAAPATDGAAAAPATDVAAAAPATDVAAAPATDGTAAPATDAAVAETKPTDDKKEEQAAVPPKKDDKKGIKEGKKEDVPLVSGTKSSKSGSKFPLVPVVVVVLVAVVVIFVIRMVRKKATTGTDSQTA